MELLDYEELPPPPRNRSTVLWNLLTLVLLLGMVCVLGVGFSIYSNPYSALNPFPPPTQPAALVIPTSTPTSVFDLPPTWTPTATGEPTATETPHPTATLPPTFTPYVQPTAAPDDSTPTPPPGGYAFRIKQRPLAVPNIAHSDKGCEWMGVAGTVEDLSGTPKTQLIVTLGGTLDGKTVDPSGTLYSLTGVAPQYGQSGYEFVLSDKPVASEGTLWVQLVDQVGAPISEKVYFDTFDNCEKNLIVIAFRQVR